MLRFRNTPISAIEMLAKKNNHTILITAMKLVDWDCFFIVGLTCYLRWDARAPAPRVKRCLLILRRFFTIRGSQFAIPRAFLSPRDTTARLPTAFNPSHLALFNVSSLKRPRSNLPMHNLLTFSFEGKLLLPALYTLIYHESKSTTLSEQTKNRRHCHQSFHKSAKRLRLLQLPPIVNSQAA